MVRGAENKGGEIEDTSLPLSERDERGTKEKKINLDGAADMILLSSHIYPGK